MKRDNLIKFLIVLVLFIVFTILIKIIDVQAIGPYGSEVGFASINDAFRDFISYNDLFYKISKYLGYISFGIILLYAITGLRQLINRKSFFKVDDRLLMLGSFYIIVLFVYGFFEMVVVNCRPVLENGSLEASYPSSHTVLAICVCASSIMVSKKIFKNKEITNWFNLFTGLLLVGIIVTRLLSGVHWLTDIIGGIIISIALMYFFSYLLDVCKGRKK